MLAFAAPAAAQTYPTQPIHLIVPFGPGGGSDIVGRIVGQALQEKLGQPVVVENRPGAGGTIGNEVIARAHADGYTLGIMTAGQIIPAVMLKSLRYDARTAFDPISQVATAGLIMVTRPDFPANNVTELVAVAKAEARQDRVRQPGLRRHPASRRRAVQADGRRRHAARAVPHLAGDHHGAARQDVDVVFETVSAVLGQVQGGKLKALAVTGKDRFPAVPDVPAAIEVRPPARLRRQHLVRHLRAARHAAPGDRQAQQAADRDHRRADRARAADQGRRGGEELQPRGVRQDDGGRARPLGDGAPEGGAGEAVGVAANSRFAEAPRYFGASFPRQAPRPIAAHRNIREKRTMPRWSAIAAAALVAALAAVTASHPAAAQSGWTALFDGKSTRPVRTRSATPTGASRTARWSPTRRRRSATWCRSRSTRTSRSAPSSGSSDDANSGIFIRCTNPNKISSKTAYEVNIFDTAPRPELRHRRHRRRRQGASPIKAGGKWNTFEITAKGSTFDVTLNGVKTVVGGSDAKFPKGRVALQYGQGVVKFRKVEIKPM